MKQPEKIIQDQILGFLKGRGVFSFFINNSVSFDPKLNQFRKRNKWHRRGVSDIIAIYRGKFLALEVKTPKGRATPEQSEFLREVADQGGYGFVVRSIDGAKQVLETIDREMK